MRLIPLTKKFFAIVDDVDFEKVNAHNWSVAEFYNANGTLKNRYAVRTVTISKGKQTTQRMHCFIVGHTGIDHKSHDGLDNRRENLRLADQSQQNGNRRKIKPTTSKFKGVFKAGNKWRVRIQFNHKRIEIGSFVSEVTAALAYDAAAKRLFGDFVVPNFPFPEVANVSK